MEKLGNIEFSPYMSQKFREILVKYYKENVKKKRTEQQYTYVFNAICDSAKCDYLDMTQDDIQGFFNRKNMKESVKVTDYNLSVLRAVSRYLDEHAEEFHIQPRFLNMFSTLNISFPDMQFKMEDLPRLEDIDMVLEFFKKNGDMVGFLSCSMVLRTSLTTKELVSLRRDMLLQDAEGGYGIRLKMTEYAYRYVKLPGDIVELIELYSRQRSDNQPFFFLNKKGKPVSERALQNRLHEACVACGVKPFTYNDLRVLSQVFMIKDGAPLEKIAEYVDIKNMSWFFRYNRVVEAFTDSPVDCVHLKVEW